MRTSEEVRETGLNALNQALGLVDMVRFIQMYSLPAGDYTAEKYDQNDYALTDVLKQYPESAGNAR